MDPSNDAMIMEDLGRKTPGVSRYRKNLEHTVYIDQNFKTWKSSEFFLLCNINHCTLTNNFCSTATPTAFLITIVTSSRKSLSGNPVGNTVDTDEGDVP